MPDTHGYALGELPATNMIEYQFPIGEFRDAYLTLPRDLLVEEVRRLEAFLLTLVDREQTP